VIAGNYVLNLGDIPADYAFPTTTQSVTIATQGQSVTADFNGSWVRTASVLVNVERADGSGVATNVRLQGEGEDQTLGTNAQGTVTFSGLKTGDYTVSLVAAPEGFTTTSQNVSVNTGQAVQINFVGERELLPPTITVASIIQAEDNEERQELNDIDEDVLVYLDVNPNGNQMTSIEFWALEKRTGDVFRVGTQRFASTVGGPELVDGIYRAEFYFNQYDFIRRRDGSHPTIEQLGADGFAAIGPDAMRPYHPIFVDGDYEFHGVVTVAEFPGETFNAIVDVTLTEGQDEGAARVILRVEADNSDWNDPETGEPFPNQLLDDEGYRWLSGDILITAYPVLYSTAYTENDPTVVIFNLELENADWVENDEPNADGSFSFKYCENYPVPNTEATGECDDDYSDVLDDYVRLEDIDAVTRFGQSIFSDPWVAEDCSFGDCGFWFEDLFSGAEDDLRVDNESPDYGGTFDVENMPHVANAIEDVGDFERSADPTVYTLGWVTWSDTISHAFDEPGLDADDGGIGMPGDEDNQPTLFYIIGPDADEPEDGDPVEIFEDESAVEVFETLVASALTPETDSPGLEDVGSAAGTPFSDSEYDYYMTARSWDRFGNWVLADTDVANYISLGVDGLAPIFTDEDGVAEDPADPTTLTSVYNTYDSGYYAPCTVDEVDEDEFECDYPGLITWHQFDEWEQFDASWSNGQYFGYTTDSGNGFA
ncbi:MAG: carboxypeptidase-like regulatory domain-containing protein, partial [Ilumatobacteraceae bacterium]